MPEPVPVPVPDVRPPLARWRAVSFRIVVIVLVISTVLHFTEVALAVERGVMISLADALLTPAFAVAVWLVIWWEQKVRVLHETRASYAREQACDTELKERMLAMMKEGGGGTITVPVPVPGGSKAH